MLGDFRLQHDNQNWLAALTTILDTCAFTMAAVPELRGRTVHLTFAMGRHAVVDLAQVFLWHRVKSLYILQLGAMCTNEIR
jgi:hypothetical protein